jgi:hypothetical protein
LGCRSGLTKAVCGRRMQIDSAHCYAGIAPTVLSLPLLSAGRLTNYPA